MLHAKKIVSGFLFLSIISLSLVPTYPAFAAAFLTLDNFSGQATTVMASGGGWTVGETISLYLNAVSGSPVTTTVVADNSFFGPTAVPIPANTPQGPLPIIAVGSISNEQQINNYYVVPFNANITVSGNNTPGSVLSIDGQGFAPGEVIQFAMEGIIMGQITADADGNFVSGQGTIPSVTAATHILHAIGQSSDADAATYFYVGGFYPSIAPSSYYLLPTQVLSFSGGGFAPGEIIDVFDGQNQTPLSSIAADGTGTFADAGSITIPLSFMGTKTFRVVGRVSHGTAQTDITVGSFIPFAAPSTFYILPGDVLTFSGGGFAVNEPVKIFDGVSQTEISNFIADAEGNFTDAGAITIPFGWTGTSHTFRLVGQIGGGVTEVMLTIGQFNSLVSPSLYNLNAGEDISFTGTGFSHGEIIMITEGQNPAVLATAIADVTGGFTDSGTITIPFDWADSSRTFTLIGQNSNTQATVIITVAKFLPLVLPSMYYLPPGSEISFTGSGFAMNETIAITNGQDDTPLATIQTDATGGFIDSGTFAIPFTWAGVQSLHFAGQSSHATSDLDITIAGFNPLISPSTYYIAPGQTLTISGTGFAPSEVISLAMNNSTPITTIASSTGDFTDAGPFVAPLSGNGIHIVATGQSSGVSATVDIGLAALYPLVTPDMWYVPSGSDITFSGNGFAPNETVTASTDDQNLGTVATDMTGSFINLVVPTGFGIDRQIIYTFTGADSNAVTQITITIAALQPFIFLDSYYASPGSTIYASGIGFGPNEQVSVYIGNSVMTATSDSTGMISSTPIIIPLGLTGPAADITMTGNTSNASAHTMVTLAPFLTQVSPSTWYTTPGSAVVFTGTGFAANEQVNIVLNNIDAGTAQADAQGNFVSTGITIPITSAQAHFVLTGTDSNTPTTIDVGLGGFTPLVTPSTWYAPVGSNIIFSGNGFAAGETVNISLNDTPVDPITADENGAFITPPIAIPISATIANFVFTGTLSNVQSEIPITLAQLNPGIQLSTYYDVGGAPITIIGMGFSSNEQVAILFGGQNLGTTPTDVSGNFAFDTTVPYLPAGNHEVHATGQSSAVSAMATFTEPQVYVGVELGSYAGAPGSAVTIIGNGFIPGEPVDIMTDRSGATAVYNFNADGTGAFNDSGYVIPLDYIEGTLTITIKGQYSLTPIQIVYYVTGV
ncbi:MAG: hypothetical protein WCW16_02805 [Candidatus Magasanikbacteria bacterium]